MVSGQGSRALKEKHEGTVTVITVGPDEAKEVLTRCLAMAPTGD